MHVEYLFMEKWVSMFFCAAALVFSGCSSDDDVTGEDPGEAVDVTIEKLRGTWEVVRVYHKGDALWDYSYGDSYGYYEQWEFRSNDTLVHRDWTRIEPEDVNVVFKSYSLDGDRVTIVESYDDGDDEVVFRVEKLTASELGLEVIPQHDEYIVNSNKVYFKRID